MGIYTVVTYSVPLGIAFIALALKVNLESNKLFVAVDRHKQSLGMYGFAIDAQINEPEE